MKRLAILLLILLLLTLPALAQTPEPTTAPTPAITPSDGATITAPAPKAEGTPEAPVATDTVPVSVVVDLLERQPELLADMTKIAVDQVGYAYERSIVLGIVFTVVGGIIIMGGGYLLYRSTPPAQRPVIARQIGGAISKGLGRLDEIDILPGTDLENIFLRAGKKAIDDKLAEIDAVVEAKVQSLYEAEKERKRANESAQVENFTLNVLTPNGPA